jgi:uncharacterized delta-60 repeat protein
VSKLYSSCSDVNLTTAICRAFLFLVLATLPKIAVAQAGQLDTSFGTSGIFSSSFNTTSTFATCVALQSDGKIIVGGEAGNPGIIVRLNTNGTIDTSFGTNGVVSLRFRDVSNFTVGVAVQSDGKILAVGTGLPQGGQLVRLNPNGSFDTSFGNAGSVGLTQTPAGLLLQPDGNILVDGAIEGQATRVIQRFTSTGSPDPSFGSGGTAALAAGAGLMALQSDGKILVASGTLSRYNTDGSIDRIFGVQGQVADLTGPAAVAVQSSGLIVTAGSEVSNLAQPTNATGFGLGEVFPTGFPVFLFGTHGGTVTPFPGFANAGAASMAIQSNSFIVTGGQAAVTPLNSAFALARYVPTGQLDGSFGIGGLVTTSFGNTTANIAAIVLQGDGKIVAVGAGGANFVVARYLGH